MGNCITKTNITNQDDFNSSFHHKIDMPRQMRNNLEMKSDGLLELELESDALLEMKSNGLLEAALVSHYDPWQIAMSGYEHHDGHNSKKQPFYVTQPINKMMYGLPPKKAPAEETKCDKDEKVISIKMDKIRNIPVLVTQEKPNKPLNKDMEI